MVLKRYFVAYGPLYVRIIISSLILMIIGTTMFQVGINYIGVNFVLPPEKLFQPLPPPYSTYVLSDVSSRVVNVTVEEDLGTYTFQTPGYFSLTIKVQGASLARVKVYRVSTTSYASEASSESKPIYVLTTLSGETLTIPINEKGQYRVVIENIGSNMITVNYKLLIYTLREKPEALIAKWLQALGLVLFGIGFLVFLLSPIIAAKYAESAYRLAPKEIREELASLGIAQLHRNRLREYE